MSRRFESANGEFEEATLSLCEPIETHELWNRITELRSVARNHAVEWAAKEREREAEEAAKEADRLATRRSALHALDLSLRKLVSEAVAEVKSSKPSNTAAAAKEINDAARTFSRDAKAGVGPVELSAFSQLAQQIIHKFL